MRINRNRVISDINTRRKTFINKIKTKLSNSKLNQIIIDKKINMPPHHNLFITTTITTIRTITTITITINLHILRLLMTITIYNNNFTTISPLETTKWLTLTIYHNKTITIQVLIHHLTTILTNTTVNNHLKTIVTTTLTNKKDRKHYHRTIIITVNIKTNLTISKSHPYTKTIYTMIHHLPTILKNHYLLFNSHNHDKSPPY